MGGGGWGGVCGNRDTYFSRLKSLCGFFQVVLLPSQGDQKSSLYTHAWVHLVKTNAGHVLFTMTVKKNEIQHFLPIK
jgi:hypothetical protein